MLQIYRTKQNMSILAKAIIIFCFCRFTCAQDSSNLLYSAISKSDGLLNENPSKIVTNYNYQDFKDFLDGADEGAIIFSERSSLLTFFMSPDVRAMFLQVFSKSPQKVIWNTRITSSIGIPSNVMITRWFPQKALLAHPNVKCFILVSYGDIDDAQEAVSRGVPIILISMFQDQIYNIKQLEENGITAHLDITTLTEDKLSLALKEIIKNSRYKHIDEELKDISDTPDPFLPWYDLFILDIIALLALATVLICKLIAKIIDIIRHLLIKNSDNYGRIYQ